MDASVDPFTIILWAEKPPGSSKVYITYTGKVTALLQLLLHCSNTRLCVKYLHCWVPTTITVQLVPRATMSVTDAISQYSGADKKGGFAHNPLTSSLFLSTKGQRFWSPPHTEQCREGRRAGTDEVYLSDLSDLYNLRTNHGRPN